MRHFEAFSNNVGHWFSKKTMLKENLCHTSAEVCSIEELLVLPKHSMRQAYHNSPIFLTTLTPLIGPRAGNFPEYFHFPGTGIPETFRVFPGNFPGT